MKTLTSVLLKLRQAALVSIAAALLLISQSALALDLNAAKSGKLVAESATGYLVATPKSTPEALSLLKTINDKRKQKYTSIAAKQNTQLVNIEKIAGEKLIKKLATGSVYQNSNGEWDKK